jgi:putative transposon-encoded protein
MNNECEIVRDLLPSYIDDICSKGSSQFVEEHINSCAACREILDSMRINVETTDEIHKFERLEAKKPFIKVSRIFNNQKKFTIYVRSFSLIFLVVGLLFLANSIKEMKEHREEISKLEIVEQEREAIMNEVFTVLGDSATVTEQEEEELLEVYDHYKGKLALLAIFPVTEVEDWVMENPAVKNEPTTIFPIEYKKAELVIGNEGIIGHAEPITPSNYDLGTVVMAKDNWVIQYEYETSYEKTVEMHHQLKHYGPSTLSFYQIPIVLFSIFLVLFIIWLFLNKNNRDLKDVIG